jgi:hypothetical protein
VINELAARLPSWRRWLLVAAIVIAVIAMYTGWDWLVTVGAAGFLLSVGPCLVLCALGICMKGKGKP